MFKRFNERALKLQVNYETVKKKKTGNMTVSTGMLYVCRVVPCWPQLPRDPNMATNHTPLPQKNDNPVLFETSKMQPMCKQVLKTSILACFGGNVSLGCK